MSRRTNTRAMQRIAKKYARQPAGPWGEVDLSNASWAPRGIVRAWSNNHFSVQLTEDPVGGLRLSVRRHDEGEITWDELQAIKDRFLGEDAWAIELYPAKADLVNVANMRHLWFWRDVEELPGWRHEALGGEA